MKAVNDWSDLKTRVDRHYHIYESLGTRRNQGHLVPNICLAFSAHLCNIWKVDVCSSNGFRSTNRVFLTNGHFLYYLDTLSMFFQSFESGLLNSFFRSRMIVKGLSWNQHHKESYNFGIPLTSRDYFKMVPNQHPLYFKFRLATNFSVNHQPV